MSYLSGPSSGIDLKKALVSVGAFVCVTYEEISKYRDKCVVCVMGKCWWSVLAVEPAQLKAPCPEP